MKKLLLMMGTFCLTLGAAWAQTKPAAEMPAAQSALAAEMPATPNEPAAQPATQMPAPADTSLESLFAPFEKVSSVQADFDQQNYLSLLTDPVQSSGTLVFQKNPSALRFMYKHPFENGLLLANNQVWRLTQNTRTLIKGAMSQTVAAQLVVWLALDRVALTQRYTITPFAGGLTFTPRTPQALAQIHVWFHDTLPGALKQVELVEHGGDKTVLHFTNVRLNEPIDGSVFEP